MPLEKQTNKRAPLLTPAAPLPCVQVEQSKQLQSHESSLLWGGGVGEPQHLLRGTFTLATSHFTPVLQPPDLLTGASHTVLGKGFPLSYTYSKCSRVPYMGPASNLTNSSSSKVAVTMN